MRIPCALFLAVGLPVMCRAAAREDNDNTWLGPDLVIARETISPDGRYAIVVPTFDAAMEKNQSHENQLADVVEHRLLGKLPDTDYWTPKNNCSVQAWWSADSSCCAAVYYNRLGFDECVAIAVHGDSFRSAEIGKQIHEEIEAAIQRQSRNQGEDRGEGVNVRARPDRTVLVRAFGTTNPKGMPGEKTYDAFFSGSYDLAANKWKKLDCHPIDPKQWNMIGSAFQSVDGELVRLVARNAPLDLAFSAEVVTSEAERVKTLDGS